MRNGPVYVALLKHYGVLWPKLVRLQLRYYILLRDSFDGDLDAMLIMAVIGDNVHKSDGFDAIEFADFENKTLPVVSQRHSNRMSISESSGIPRESVRRKVELLRKKGFVAQNEQGGLIVAPGVGRKLQQVTLKQFEIFDDMNRIFEEAKRLVECEADEEALDFRSPNMGAASLDAELRQQDSVTSEVGRPS